MGKKYVMFVDERGFVSSEENKNLTMIGVIFEYDYCINSKNIECGLKTKLDEYKKEILSKNYSDVPFDDIILNENMYSDISITLRNNIIKELPSLFKGLKFTVISSTIKQDSNRLQESYFVLAKKLFTKFYSFILSKSGETGGIVIEARGYNSSQRMQQNFFNVYNERNINSNMIDDIGNRINTFIVCEKDHKTYGLGLQVLNILNSIIYRVSNGCAEVEETFVSNIEYVSENKIFDVVRNKIYKGLEVGISNIKPKINEYNNISVINNELLLLKEQLKLRDIRISEKEREIDKLSNEIKLLNKRLEEVLFEGKNDGFLTKILCDIDVKMKNFEKMTAISTGAKN